MWKSDRWGETEETKEGEITINAGNTADCPHEKAQGLTE